MRRKTRKVPLKETYIGSDYPVVIQTMWDAPIDCVDDALIARINALGKMGCGAIRFGVPTQEDAVRLGEIAQKVILPVIADIHFDYRIALRCMDFSIAKLRINPGNIGASWMVHEIAEKAKDKKISLRVGVNGGSIARYYRDQNERGQALAQCAMDQVEVLKKVNFEDIVISVKDSDPHSVLEANRILAKETDYPLHLGITEAGPLIPSIVKSSLFLGKLLEEGIGDTIRISISDEIEYEVMAGRQLLAYTGHQHNPMPTIISCPRCARATFDTHQFTMELEKIAYTMKKDIKVAVMGCVVNGPGEAGEVDVAIAGTGKQVFVYEKGKHTFSGSTKEAEAYFLALLENWPDAL
ncbi:MAG: flavodoxin-dependent (E)-4-hydroxy-3-methylbut-2-enyl-diphosphate synthase [Spirochaetia bacterium]